VVLRSWLIDIYLSVRQVGVYDPFCYRPLRFLFICFLLAINSCFCKDDKQLDSSWNKEMIVKLSATTMLTEFGWVGLGIEFLIKWLCSLHPQSSSETHTSPWSLYETSICATPWNCDARYESVETFCSCATYHTSVFHFTKVRHSINLSFLQ
jgi:hypothetical protein